jgi:hypothetical protein
MLSGKKMIEPQETAEILLRLKIVQLEGKIALYESLMQDLSKTETIQRVAEDIKVRLDGVFEAWNRQKPVGDENG